MEMELPATSVSAGSSTASDDLLAESPGRSSDAAHITRVLHSRLLRLPGRWAYGEDGTALFVYPTEQRFTLLPPTSAEQKETECDVGDPHLFSAIDWSQPRLVFAATPERYVPIVCEAARAVTGVAFDVHWHHVWMADRTVDGSSGNSVGESDDFEMRPLAEADAAFVDQHWSNRHPGSLEMLRRCIQLYPSVAIWHRGQPVSWALTRGTGFAASDMPCGVTLNSGQGSAALTCDAAVRAEHGAIGCLTTMPAYRGRGLARRVIRQLMGQLLQTSHVPYGFVSTDNVASQHVLRSCGFRPVARVAWVTRPAPRS